MTITILTTEAFNKLYRKAPKDVQIKFKERIRKLKAGETGALREHPLKGFKPTVYKFDVFPNKSWQVSFHKDGETYTLLSIGPHKFMDRLYR